MRMLSLVEDYVISCYNHLVRGDYNTKTLIFKFAASQFPDVPEEETENERKYSCSDYNLSNYTKTIILLMLWCILSNNRLRDYSTILTSPCIK